MTREPPSDPFVIAGETFTSRVLMGSAMYPSAQIMLDALAASGAHWVTVALRRVRPQNGGGDNLYGMLREQGYRILPNTAGCFTADEAVRTAHMAREALATPWVKLEVIADDETLLPEPFELLTAAETLAREGFTVLPYTNDDPVLARRLEDVGCAAVMPLAAPIGTGLGVQNPHNLRLIKAQAQVPVIVDAGLGSAADVALAFELGCDGVLLNSAVARARKPVLMAAAVRDAARAGRAAYLAGRIPRKFNAEATSSLEDRPWQE